MNKFISFALVAISSSYLVGCSVTPHDPIAYETRQGVAKCYSSAEKQVQDAYINKESTLRFEPEQKKRQKALVQYDKKVSTVKSKLNACLTKVQQKNFEATLRRELGYRS